MKATRLADNIGKEVTISEKMRVVHSVELAGDSLLKPLTVDYLRGESEGVLVQVKSGKGKPQTWDLNAIVTADFHSGKLEGIKKFAENIVDSEHPVAALRQLLIGHAAGIVPTEQKACPSASAMVTHSEVRSD